MSATDTPAGRGAVVRGTCVGFFELGQYVAGELADAQRQRVAAHLEACASCRAQLAQIEADVSAYAPLAEAGYAAAWQDAAVEPAAEPAAELDWDITPKPTPKPTPKRAGSSKATRRRRWPVALKVVVPLAAAALIAVLVIPRLITPPGSGGDPRGGSGYVAYKGALSLQVIAKRGARQFVVAPDARMCSGDALRFTVTAAWPKTHVMVFSRDAAGTLSTFYPNNAMPSGALSSSGRTVALDGQGRHVLAGSIVLDDSRGREVIVLLAADKPFDPRPLRARIDKLLARDAAAAAATLSAAKVGFSGVLRALVIVKAPCS